MKKIFLLVSIFSLSLPVATADMWNTIKQGATDTTQAVGGAVSSGAEAVTDMATPDKSRQEIDDKAAEALKRLFAEKPGAKALFDVSHGYAVFDTRKTSFLITAGFGVGVAVDQATSARTYMKMATGGVNVGMGAQWFQLVFLFESEAKFRMFVDKGWDAGAGGSAVVWEDGANLDATFTNGLAVYELNDKGLMLSADLTGTKYWQDDELNAK